ncbi:MAG: cytochrome c biogenesis protein CcdA [candidate division WOR-3 bacterium]
MLTAIFTWLTNTIQGVPVIAILGSFLWGVLSILLSPCHLASIPLIVGFISGQETTSTKRAFWLATLFSLGILVTIAIIGIITGLMGRMLGDVGKYGNYIVAVIFFIVGLYLLEIIKLPFLSNAAQPGLKKRGLLASFVLGLVFGIALGPCTFAYMAPMLALTFSIASTRLFYGIFLLLIYGLGHCSIIVAAGTFTEIIEHYLHWSEKSNGIKIVKKVCGVLVILGGIYLLWIA